MVQYASDLEELARLLEAGDAEVGVAIPAGLERSLKAPGREPNIQIIASGANTIVGKVGLSAAEQAIANTIAGVAAPAGTSHPAIDLRTTVLFNPTLNSRNYTVPAMIGLIAGKAVAPLVITLGDFALMLLIAVTVFGTPMRSSVSLLFGLTILFMLAEIVWGAKTRRRRRGIGRGRSSERRGDRRRAGRHRHARHPGPGARPGPGRL